MKTDTKKKNLKTSNQVLMAPFKVGDVLTVKIHALTGNQLGLSQLANGYTILVPRASVGQEVRVTVESLSAGKLKYATAKVVADKAAVLSVPAELPVRTDDILEVTLSKPGPKGSALAQVAENYTIVVPKAKVGDQVKIQISRVKKDYAFATILTKPETTTGGSRTVQENTNCSSASSLASSILENSKFHLVLPKTAKIYKEYALVKVAGRIVFVKLGLGAKLGDTVRVQMMKTGSEYAVAKILKVSPLSKGQKLILTKTQVQQMIQKGMHFGEKAIRCHANMRSYLWYRQKGQTKNLLAMRALKGRAKEQVRQYEPLLKKDRYYLNVLKTRRCLRKALKQLAKYAAKGQTFLFVGTKKSASALIARTALFTKTSFFVNTRWLGGMLTNWKTIKRSMARIRPILKEKQKVIQSILEKRQKIKYRFIQKVNLLRRRGQKLMLKGKNLIAQLKQNKNVLIERSQKLLQKKQEILAKNQIFIQKYIELKRKKTEYIKKSQILSQKGNVLVYQKQNLLKQLKNNQARLQEFKQLFLIGQELLKVKNNATKQGQQILSVSYGKLQELSPILQESAQMNSFTVPNPPKEVLNRMIQSMKMKYETSILEKNSVSKTLNAGKANVSVSNTVVLSRLLNKFTSFLPFMKVYIENLILRHQNIVILLQNNQKNMNLVQTQVESFKQFYQKVSVQLSKVKSKLVVQQTTLKTLRTKLRRLAAEQRLLKFLPKLRYLPTPKAKMAQTIQTLMKKFVDPKMTVPMEQIYDDRFKFTSKKIAAARKQQWQRLEKYFGGITKMSKMKKKQISNNVAIIVGQHEEMNAVRECQKLGIKMFTLVDTNCNPKFADHVIPVNDDSRNSVKFILEEMLTHIRLAQKLRQKVYLHKTKRNVKFPEGARN